MSNLLWRIRYAFHFRRLTGYGSIVSWQAARAVESWQIEDSPPLEAVETELSYWTE